MELAGNLFWCGFFVSGLCFIFIKTSEDGFAEKNWKSAFAILVAFFGALLSMVTGIGMAALNA